MNTDEIIKVCMNFLKMWENHDWEGIQKYCQKTWVEEGHPTLSIVDWFESWFGVRALCSYSVTGYRVKTDCTVDVDVQVVFDNTMTGKKETKTMHARVLCEEAAYTPSVDGTWGVNPVSCLRMN